MFWYCHFIQDNPQRFYLTVSKALLLLPGLFSVKGHKGKGLQGKRIHWLLITSALFEEACFVEPFAAWLGHGRRSSSDPGQRLRAFINMGAWRSSSSLLKQCWRVKCWWSGTDNISHFIRLHGDTIVQEKYRKYIELIYLFNHLFYMYQMVFPKRQI